ncbi:MULTISPECIES: triose-phosphate isomerase [Bacillus]|uniref:triose-phosphate isomerase n=1 Tax=Bacillus TaxID=1386 RepID=UPI001D0D7B02|nr:MULTISPECIES: triose-phosphate isomerase [Bacillus]
MMDQAIQSYIKSLVKDAIQEVYRQQPTKGITGRQTYVVANWKMNKTLSEAASFVQEMSSIEGTSVVICPPTQLLYQVRLLLEQQGLSVKVGAQNVHQKDSGAFTGETSAEMLNDIGCEFVIIGHSERRQYSNECDALVNKKVQQAIGSNLTPIICIGETLEEKNNGQTERVLTKQILGALQDIQSSNFLVAYEPVWAIGTGQSATAEQAQATHKYIRAVLQEVVGSTAESISILYGGSVNESNAKEYASQSDIDGVLVGGASLKVQTFEPIIHVFAKGDN